MTHFTEEQWQQYVTGDLTDQTREQLENHLYTCDQCLEKYLKAVEVNETSLPALPDTSDFTELVMGALNTVPVTENTTDGLEKVPVTKSTSIELELVPGTTTSSVKKRTSKRPLYQRAVFHYLLAAAATILLTFTGAFQSLAKYANSLEAGNVQEKRPSVTEGVIDKTFAWMDSLEKKEAIRK
ncbi:anti-sigma factor family protein [Neobacillus sp. LXY-1]|uniref:anti-sigma factor family protein n=1 Tax=Neobacillus sp. LXY-1 TaxID=3379133 RepID=UPI003EE2DA86